MFILANFFEALAKLSELVLTLYMYAVVARAIISWFNVDPYNPIVRFLHKITDPVLYKIRRFIPVMGGLDLSPIVLILGLYFLNIFLVSTLYNFADVFR
ncbi:MAG: YggT family protein [bacterium]